MSALIERLRERAVELSGRSIDRGCMDSGISARLADEAADEIERLTTALTTIAEHSNSHSDFPHSTKNLQQFARASLAPEGK